MSPIAPSPRRWKENRSIAAEFEGALLISSSLFPYFMLVSLEAGGPVRALALLLLAPLVRLLELAGLECVALRVMIFVATAGLRVVNLQAAAQATLPKFYLENLRRSAYRVFAGCGGKRYVITSCPRIMAEPFSREYLDVDGVLGTELRAFQGFFLGLTSPGGFMSGSRRLEALHAAMAGAEAIDVGLCGKDRDQPFMSLCAERYCITPQDAAQPVPRSEYPKPLIFHDGRLVALPTPLDSLIVLLWIPFGVVLVTLRILLGLSSPYKLCLLCTAATGVRIRAQFHEPRSDAATRSRSHTLFVCNHRTLVDPVIISTALRRKVTAVTYSVSRLSELISPIPTIRLRRDRFEDGARMRSSLGHGDLVVCPEGTTCREPYLLRFSPLFAEIAEDIVPVAVTNEGSMFYGTTVRGHKCLDSFFFLMNPRPSYGLDFLAKVPGGQKSKYDVANHIQQAIGRTIGFECTNLTRKDKYRMLAGHDGLDPRK
ncbi:glycerol-3-phosphate acyltransferase RAM2-like [Musa acuminata AAA Group]|uniref:glycerol-3-phosphate acyltransferase RAM2-like n=1 Tax=Musa acuminata AAA Group TaxID=214697 RepID=UPI0031DB4D64